MVKNKECEILFLFYVFCLFFNKLSIFWGELIIIFIFWNDLMFLVFYLVKLKVIL